MKNKIISLLFVLLPMTLVAQQSSMVYEKTTHDFGTIQEEKGAVNHVFAFENEGKNPIIIKAVQADCGCTTPLWSKEPVLPGKKGTIKVSYNPKNRPGKFNKSITINTNVGTQKLYVKGEVTPRPKSVSEIYPKKMEQLRLMTSYAMFKEIERKHQRNIEIAMINTGKAPAEISFGKSPDYLSVKAEPAKIASGEKGKITIVYDAEKVKDWGFKSDLIPVLIDGKSKASNNLVVTATVVDDFSNYTKEDMEKAPVVGVTKLEGNFQSVIAGDKVKMQFKIVNVGKTPLLLHNIDSSSEALQVTISEKKIDPGKQGLLDATFDTSGKRGYQNQQITVITNAPDAPLITFKISGIVE